MGRGVEEIPIRIKNTSTAQTSFPVGSSLTKHSCQQKCAQKVVWSVPRAAVCVPTIYDVSSLSVSHDNMTPLAVHRVNKYRHDSGPCQSKLFVICDTPIHDTVCLCFWQSVHLSDEWHGGGIRAKESARERESQPHLSLFKR